MAGGSLNRARRWVEATATVALVAIVAGFAAAGIAFGIEQAFEEVLDAPTALAIWLPAVGLVINALVRHLAGRRCGPATIDAYVGAFHGAPVDVRANVARVAGGAATVGLGAALDPAGPATLAGTTIGHLVRRARHRADPDLLVVGAAAGLAAALQSPVAGAVLAVELPFRDGANWRRLPLALAGSLAGFFARGAVDDLAIPFRTDVGVVGVRDVVLTLVLAFAAGFASRLVAWLARRAETGLGTTFGREWHHVFGGAVILTGLGALCLAAFDDVAGGVHLDGPVTLGPGTHALPWAAEHSVAIILALITVRAVASGASVLGRGAGGLLLPILVLGLLAGHALGDFADANVALLAIVGAATLLGAAYRVPAAAAVWIVESTHSVPATLVGGVAVLVAASIGGGRSVSTAQRAIGF